MATKVEMYQQRLDHATVELTADVKNWTAFLITAGRFHKQYNFLDHVMILSQKRTASALAEFDVWTQLMNRRIRRGAKGIALVDQRGGRPALRYVFDVADTIRSENSRDPSPWQYKSEHEQAVMARLEEAFGMPGGESLDKQLIALSVQFADQRWHDHKHDIMRSVQGSLLDELDEDNVAYRFCPALTVSLAFLLLARCGFDLKSYFTRTDFAAVKEFNTLHTVRLLGEAVSESGSLILRQVEFAVRKYERDKAAGALPPAQPPVEAEPAQPPELDTQQGGGDGTAAA